MDTPEVHRRLSVFLNSQKGSIVRPLILAETLNAARTSGDVRALNIHKNGSVATGWAAEVATQLIGRRPRVRRDAWMTTLGHGLLPRRTITELFRNNAAAEIESHIYNHVRLVLSGWSGVAAWLTRQSYGGIRLNQYLNTCRRTVGDIDWPHAAYAFAAKAVSEAASEVFGPMNRSRVPSAASGRPERTQNELPSGSSSQRLISSDSHQRGIAIAVPCARLGLPNSLLHIPEGLDFRFVELGASKIVRHTSRPPTAPLAVVCPEVQAERIRKILSMFQCWVRVSHWITTEELLSAYEAVRLDAPHSLRTAVSSRLSWYAHNQFPPGCEDRFRDFFDTRGYVLGDPTWRV